MVWGLGLCHGLGLGFTVTSRFRVSVYIKVKGLGFSVCVAQSTLCLGICGVLAH